MGSKTVLAERCEAAVRGIEDTRRRIGDRAGLLQDRLSPRAALKPLTKRLQGTVGKGGQKILDAFRDNPIPLALTGVGIAWLLLEDLQGKPRQEAPGTVRRSVDRATGWFSDTLEENPMALAVAALALGAVAGLCFPAGEKEETPASPEPPPAPDEIPPSQEAPD
jgi:hypothetical protein